MIKKLLVLGAFALSLNTIAQVSHGGQPFNWSDKHVSASIQVETLPAIDLAALAAEDAVVDQYKEAPYRFGYEHETSFDVQSHGEWRNLGNGKMIWQLGIVCPEARSLNFKFEDFYLPKGAELFIWASDREEYMGSFNHLNNHESRVLTTSILQSGSAVVEVIADANVANQVSFTITQVVHGYRPVLLNHFAEFDADRGPYGTSGACNNNVNCPEGAAWQTEKRAVAIILDGGSAMCTGALVNNTANDGTPYFLTANHCWGGVTTSSVFIFNHEAATCSGTTGPTDQSISGCVLRAKNAGSDFCLVQLNSTPPASYNVQYSGWDASDNNNVINATGIHHPSGDIKKISFENDPLSQGTWSGAQTWNVAAWDNGITEPGSSGSPLFNQDHRIIGQLYGGGSACSGSVENGLGDSYGRFGISWNTGTTSATRLKDWLDPGNTGQLIIDGYPTGASTAALDAGASSISNVPASVCGSSVSPVVSMMNMGSTTLTSAVIQYSVNGGSTQTYNWTGSLSQYASTTINLPSVNLVNGANTITVTIVNPNNSTDENTANNSISVSCNAVVGPAANLGIAITLDNYPEETSWDLQLNGVVVASSNGTYASAGVGANINETLCIASGCYDFTIYDDFGDGICCSYGTGSYTVTNTDGSVLASGGSFTDQETTNVCVTVGVEEWTSQLSMYPNPAQNEVQLIGLPAKAFIQIIDISGKVVRTETTYSSNVRLGLDALSNGYYTVRVMVDNGVKNMPLIVKK